MGNETFYGDGLMRKFKLFSEVFCLYCSSFGVEFEQSKTIKNIRSEKYLYTRKINTWVR